MNTFMLACKSLITAISAETNLYFKSDLTTNKKYNCISNITILSSGWCTGLRGKILVVVVGLQGWLL